MEDRFRVRGWLVEEKRMVTITQIDLDRKLAWITNELSGYNIPDEIIPLQCTGLKDKNSDLIYEGDKVTITRERGLNNIEWDRGAWRVTQNGVDRLLGNWHNQCLVVGNIYEEKKSENIPKTVDVEELRIWLKQQIGVVDDPTSESAYENTLDWLDCCDKACKYTCNDCARITENPQGMILCFDHIWCSMTGTTTRPGTPACENFVHVK